MITNNSTVLLLASLGRIAIADGFRELESNDKAAFEGAGPEALIAFGGADLAHSMTKCFGMRVPQTDGAVSILVDNGRVSLIGCDEGGEPFSVTLDICDDL